jgi:hypothetical protein
MKWLDPAIWDREGPGRSWSFSLPTRAVRAELESFSAQWGGGFELLACSGEQFAQEWLSVYEVLPVHELSGEGTWQYALRSLDLTPALPSA